MLLRAHQEALGAAVAAWLDVGDLVGDPADDDGVGAAVGVRGKLSKKFELQGQAAYYDFGADVGNDDTQFEVQALYNATRRFSIGLSYLTTDNFDMLGIGARFYWGKN